MERKWFDERNPTDGRTYGLRKHPKSIWLEPEDHRNLIDDHRVGRLGSVLLGWEVDPETRRLATEARLSRAGVVRQLGHDTLFASSKAR
jgi:hypothetical protein